MTSIQTTTTTKKRSASTSEFLPRPYEDPHIWRQLDELLSRVSEFIAPVWPLKDFVAINPYQGLADRPFLDARAFVKVFSDCEMLMPMEYYARQFQNGELNAAEIEAAIGELKAAGIRVDATVDQITEKLDSIEIDVSAERSDDQPAANPDRRIHTVAETVDRYSRSNWGETIRAEIGKFCVSQHDEGQAVWSSPWKHLHSFQAWWLAARHDRNLEVLGVKGFRTFVSQLPHTPEAAIVHLLQLLKVPQQLWEPFLLCQALSIPGWCGWAKYKDQQASHAGRESDELTGLLAIRLAYDVALSKAFSTELRWDAFIHGPTVSFHTAANVQADDSIVRFIMLRATEIAYRRQLLDSLSHADIGDVDRKLAQMVFCIDVRSERIRYELENVSEDIETFGFAGFFGMPIEYVPLAADRGSSQVPALLKPRFQLRQGVHHEEAGNEAAMILQRTETGWWQKHWKDFQSSAIGCFSFVEMNGLLYGLKLLAQTITFNPNRASEQDDDAVGKRPEKLGPTLRGLDQQGITTSHQADLAESMLKQLGLTRDFARLVVFCGHSSQTENNPLAASLDCGACGGHSGEPNARMAALMLNQPAIRSELAKRGIDIPQDTWFVAALHNTTTDGLAFFDLEHLPAEQLLHVRQLLDHSKCAARQARRKRVPQMSCKSADELMRRASDWSEVRPEWGLAGNAAMIVAPRSLTRGVDLRGQAFLHSYDYQNDPDGCVLEAIMTAPMVVAHWINMQYFASTVDPYHFGSGNKAIHDVVGRFGVVQGNGGDLKTGLPWQSLRTKEKYQHLPLRLQAIIAAPRPMIEQVIEKHELLANLVANSWLNLVAIDDGRAFRHAEDGSWQALDQNPVATSDNPVATSDSTA